MAKTKIKADAVDAPDTSEQADELLSDIGCAQRKVQKMEADYNDKALALKQAYQDQAKPLNDSISTNFTALHAWAEANKNDLLKGKLKTHKMPSGEISWRKTPPKVTIRGMAVVVVTFKKLKLEQFLRTKQEVNKDAILADPEAVEQIKGVSITSKEEFVVKPFETELEKVETIK